MTCAKQKQCQHGDGCFMATDYDVARCTAFKPLVQTNEEWLHTLNTEQLAEWIASVVQKAISIKENNGIVMLESDIWWEEWLKQTHRDTK